jgi:hypothetical protein
MNNPLPSQKKPVISFCIPTYNRSTYLLETIESIRLAVQHLPTGVGYEIIVSDNASTDDTEKLLNCFVLSHEIRYLRRPSTTHPADNLLFACAHAFGEFIWLLGDDDPMFEDAPRRLVELIETTTVDYIFVPRVLVNKDLSSHPCGMQPAQAVKGVQKFGTGKDLFADRELEFSHLVGFYGCSVIRRVVWEESVAMLDRTTTALRLDPWGHLRVIVHAIRERPCGVMDQPGVRCRLNPSPLHGDSRLWLDGGIRCLQDAERWGYPAKIIRQEIRFCFHANACMFVKNKAALMRKGNLFKVADDLQCRDIINEHDFWVLLSRLPPILLRWFFLLRYLFVRSLSLSKRIVTRKK